MNSFSVPYDVMNGTRKFGVGGKDLGLSGKNHRNKTLGHDPLFGWVFGTSNIMTNTLTNDKGITFHVKNSAVVSNGSFDKTARMFAHVSERSKDNPEDLGICIIKQGLHLASDTYSKAGIVLPGTVKLDSNLARNLADYGVDFGNTINAGVNTSISVLINQIIAMIHGMLYDESVEDGRNIYAVRTRKILLYSNCIANMSNIIAVACGTAVGVVTDNVALTKKSLNYLDIGGLIVTIHRIVSDKKFIAQVKQEFLENHWYEEISNIGRNGKIYE